MTTPAATLDVAALLRDLRPSAADLAGARAALAESRAARATAEQAAADAGKDATSALRRGTALYLLGRVREAARELHAAGDGAAARLVRGKASLEDGDPIGAAEALGALGEKDGADGTVAVDLATACALSGDASGAAAAAKRAGSAGKAEALYAEAMALEAAGKHREAIAKLEASVEAAPTYGRALFQLAHALDVVGEDERAMELYRRCTVSEPTYANALVNLGILLEDHDRYPEAEACYRRVLAADPTHERARLYLKDVLSAQTMFYDEDNERKEDRRNQILRTPISEFELSVRSRNCLAKMEIKTLGDLITKSEAELLAYKNFGETSLQEIKDILAQKGLRLGMGLDETGPLATREEAEAELEALFGGAAADDEDDDDDDDALDDAVADPRALPLDALGLSVRARKSIESFEMETVGDLANRTADELLANKAVGHTVLSEIRKHLEAHGITLKGE